MEMSRTGKLIFGDSLPEAVERIQVKALEYGTKEAFNNAYQQLQGIQTLLIYMGFNDEILMFNGPLNKMSKMADDDKFREAILTEMRKSGLYLSRQRKTT